MYGCTFLYNSPGLWCMQTGAQPAAANWQAPAPPFSSPTRTPHTGGVIEILSPDTPPTTSAVPAIPGSQPPHNHDQTAVHNELPDTQPIEFEPLQPSVMEPVSQPLQSQGGSQHNEASQQGTGHQQHMSQQGMSQHQASQQRSERLRGTNAAAKRSASAVIDLSQEDHQSQGNAGRSQCRRLNFDGSGPGELVDMLCEHLWTHVCMLASNFCFCHLLSA